MINAPFFSKLQQTAQHMKQNFLPFGGVRLILVADFEQLPPIGDVMSEAASGVYVRAKGEFIFTWSEWQQGQFDCYWLDHSWRYGDDICMVKLAASVRGNTDARLDAEASELMRQLFTRNPPDAQADADLEVTLCARHDTANRTNAGKLARLPGDAVKYVAQDKIGHGAWKRSHMADEASDDNSNIREEVPWYMDENGRKRSVYDSIQAKSRLSLKVGAHVMCIKNMKDSPVVNGSLGFVTGFTEDLPIEQSLSDWELPYGMERTDILAKFQEIHAGSRWPKVELTMNVNGHESKETRVMMPDIFTFENEHQEIIVARLQVPLILRYALTIHKSQGLTLPYVAVNVEVFFVHGQLYTALTRVRNFQHLRLFGGSSLPRRWLLADKAVVDFYRHAAWIIVDNSA